MNPLSCCSSCSSTQSGSIFPLGSYLPYSPGYGHTFNGFSPVGVAGPNMGVPVARPYPGQTPLPIASGLNPYERGEGNPNPYYRMPTFNSFYSSGKPNGFNPLSSYPSASNPMGSISPVGDSLPANVGHPYRVGDGIGGQVESLGSWFSDTPFNHLY